LFFFSFCIVWDLLSQTKCYHFFLPRLNAIANATVEKVLNLLWETVGFSIGKREKEGEKEETEGKKSKANRA